MAKGRKLNHNRFLDTAAAPREVDVGGADLPDLVEDDVWSTIDYDAHDGDNQQGWFDSRQAPGSVRGALTRRWSAREVRQVGGLSLAFEDVDHHSTSHVIHQFRNLDSHQDHNHHHHHDVASSAPVNVPDWTKILRVDSAESLHGMAATTTEIEVEDGDRWLPPHEYLQAREQAAGGGKMVVTSVFEGVGRTLKGRDMSRVRNAVWRQTGFFG